MEDRDTLSWGPGRHAGTKRDPTLPNILQQTFPKKYLNFRVRWIRYKETGLQHEIALADKMSMRIYMITIEGENINSRARRGDSMGNGWFYRLKVDAF